MIVRNEGEKFGILKEGKEMETKSVERLGGKIVVFTNTGRNEIAIDDGIETFEDGLSEKEKEKIRKAAAPLLQGHKIFAEGVAKRWEKTFEQTKILLKSKNIADFRAAFENEKLAMKEFCWVQTIAAFGTGFTYEPHKDGIAVRVGGSGGRIQWVADENLELHTRYVYFADGSMKKEVINRVKI